MHMFGVGHNKPSRSNAKKITSLARTCGANFVEVYLPGTGYQHWFTGPNYGAPFDDVLKRAVFDALKRAGLLDHQGKIRSGQA